MTDDLIKKAADKCEQDDAAGREPSMVDVFIESLRPPTQEELGRILRPINTNPRTWQDLEKPL